MAENFLLTFKINNDKLLNGLIDYHKNNTEYKYESGLIQGKEVKDSTDVPIQMVSNNKFVKEYYGYLQDGLKEYSKRYKHFNGELCIQEGFNIQHYSPGQGYKKWHNERPMHQAHQRALVFMTYLNDVPDGGGTEFAYYPEIKLKAEKGLTLLWPTDFTHTHRGIISQHEKWIATGWFHHLDAVQTLFQRKMIMDSRLKEKK